AATAKFAIGTSAPTALFQVTQGTFGPGVASTYVNGTTVSGTNTEFTKTFRLNQAITINGETRQVASIASDTRMTVGVAFTNLNSGISYTANGGDRFFVNGNGFVGIGTADPATALEVSAPSSGGGISTDGSLVVGSSLGGSPTSFVSV